MGVSSILAHCDAVKGEETISSSLGALVRHPCLSKVQKTLTRPQRAVTRSLVNDFQPAESLVLATSYEVAFVSLALN